MALPRGKILFLSVSYYPYRVPVFDLLYEHLGEHFLVVSISRQRKGGYSGLALQMGKYPRRILTGLYLELSRRHHQGEESPLGLVLAPSFAVELLILRPQLVISANFNLWTLISLLMGYPTVIFFEGTHHTERTVRPWRTRLRQWMIKQAKAFVVNGKLSRQYLEQLGADPNHIVEGGLCPLPAPRQTRRKTDGFERPLRFLFVGRLVDGKGVRTLLEAARILHQQETRPFEVVLLGEGSQREHYRQIVESLELGQRVHFAGAVQPEEVWQYYQNADVFVLPTLQDNWPLVVPEAMSVGLPILLSKVAGSVPDLIEEGGNGWSFDPLNPVELAKHMAAYLNNPDLVRRHGQRSLELVKPYTPERVYQAFMQAIYIASSRGQP